MFTSALLSKQVYLFLRGKEVMVGWFIFGVNIEVGWQEWRMQSHVWYAQRCTRQRPVSPWCYPAATLSAVAASPIYMILVTLPAHLAEKISATVILKTCPSVFLFWVYHQTTLTFSVVRAESMEVIWCTGAVGVSSPYVAFVCTTATHKVMMSSWARPVLKKRNMQCKKLSKCFI